MPLFIVLLLLLAATPAHAGTARFVMESPSGPTVWDGGARIVVLKGRELLVLGPRRRLATLPPVPGTRGHESGTLAASPRWVVVRRDRVISDRQGPIEARGEDVSLVAVDGAVTRLDGCDAPAERFPKRGSADVDGDLAAWTDTGCTREDYVTVRDLATGEQRRIDLQEDVDVHVRGDWIALDGLSGMSVYHREGTAPVFTVPRDRLSTYAKLADDGSVVDCAAGRLVRATASSPEPQPIPGADGCFQEFDVAGGRVAWRRSFRFDGGDVTLVSAPLDGSAPPQQMLASPWWLVGFDGMRAVVGVQDDCTGRRGFAIVGDPADPPEPPATCPARIGRGPLRLRPGRWSRVPLACPRGCFVRSVRVVVGRTLVASRIWRRVPAGARGIDVRVPRAHARLIARSRTARIAVDVTDRCCTRETTRRVRLAR